jgi:hypothetical protein
MPSELKNTDKGEVLIDAGKNNKRVIQIFLHPNHYGIPCSIWLYAYNPAVTFAI